MRASATPTTPLELARAYLPKLAEGEFFSHTTAALIHGMWLPLDLEREMVTHVSVRKPKRAPRDSRVVGHHLVDRPGLVWTVDGMPVAGPWETWCQLARMLSVRDLVVAGEALLAKPRPGTQRMRARLREAAQVSDRPFPKRLLAAAPQLRMGSRSAAESRFRLFLVANGLPEPLINHDLFDALGHWLAEGDLVYLFEKVLIEYEGDGHRERRQFRKDIRRVERIVDDGWRVIRVTEDDVRNDPAETIARIWRALRRRR